MAENAEPSPGINFKLLARVLTMVENNLLGYDKVLKDLNINSNVPVIGITGPPGAGKSTIVNALLNQLLSKQKKVAVLAVDPTSPFNHGALLGDRIRMNNHFNRPDVFIRSIATRGAVGGLSVKTMEMADVLRSSGFDYVIVETVGVGQSEIDIAGLADITIVVLVPEAGDEIQHIKSGLMEIANIFVVNKADRAGAEAFASNLEKLLYQQHAKIPVFKTIATNNTGISDLTDYLQGFNPVVNSKHLYLLTEKVYRLIQQAKMRSIQKATIHQLISEALLQKDFNVYRFAEKFNMTNS